MSAVTPIELQQSAVVNEITRTPLSGSRKAISKTKQAHCAYRCVKSYCHPTLLRGQGDTAEYEINEPLRIYDTSGPYTDPAAEIDLHKGLDREQRQAWIDARADTEQLDQFSSTFTRESLEGNDYSNL